MSANKEAAPNIVTRRSSSSREFEEALRQLTAAGYRPALRRSRGRLIRHLLMKKTRCHVYFFHDTERDLIEIHSIWGARRRRGPALESAAVLAALPHRMVPDGPIASEYAAKRLRITPQFLRIRRANLS